MRRFDKTAKEGHGKTHGKKQEGPMKALAKETRGVAKLQQEGGLCCLEDKTVTLSCSWYSASLYDSLWSRHLGVVLTSGRYAAHLQQPCLQAASHAGVRQQGTSLCWLQKRNRACPAPRALALPRWHPQRLCQTMPTSHSRLAHLLHLCHIYTTIRVLHKHRLRHHRS